MSNFNDDENFSFEENFNPEEAKHNYEQERSRVEGLPIMKQAREIYKIVDSLMSLIEDDGCFMDHYRETIFQDAALIRAKIAAAEGADLYSLRMENAVLVKIHARSLEAHTYGLEMMDFKEVHYLEVLREAIEDFRLLFIQWVASFDKANDIQDNWGQLFC